MDTILDIQLYNIQGVSRTYVKVCTCAQAIYEYVCGYLYSNNLFMLGCLY